MDARGPWARAQGFLRSRWGKVSVLLILAVALAGEQVVFAALNGSGRVPRQISMPHTFRGKINLALHDALGSSDRGVRRFRIVSLKKSANGYRLTVRWAINNDLSSGTVGNGAQADAYLAFSDLFALHIAFDRVDLVGTYPDSKHGGETPVMRLWIDRSTARVISSYGWSTLDPETVWPLIHRAYVAPDFQPVPLN